MRTQIKTCQLLNARENVGIQVLIGWEDGVSFLDQSQSEVTQNQNIPEFTFDTHFKIVLFVRHQSEEPQSFLR